MKAGYFHDEWRGNGVQLVLTNWTIAMRWRWRLRLVRPPMKTGYTRLYIGPLEVEHREAPNSAFGNPCKV